MVGIGASGNRRTTMGRKSREAELASKMLTIRCTPAQLAELHRRAREAGVKSTSEWALRLLLAPVPAE
jgi:hypothetical protein